MEKTTIVCLSALLAAGNASAATVRGSCRASYYPVLSTDLLQTAMSSTIDKLTINTAENNANSHGTLAVLTDGTFGGVGANGGLCIAGGSVTYILDTTVNKTGYTILAINTYAGWVNSGRSEQNYTVSFRRVGSSKFGDAITATKNYKGADASTCLKLSNINLTGVDAVQFTFPEQQNGGVGYKELDVIGGTGSIVALAQDTEMEEEFVQNRKSPLSRAKLGVFVHYVCGLTPATPQGGNLADRGVDAFARALDVEALAELTKQAGAEYLIFTAYHAGIRMLYPSKVWAEVFPDKVSKRDLIGDLADACKKRGLGLVLYVHPNDRHDLNPAEQQKLIDAGWAESILTKDSIWIDKEGDLADTGRRGTDPKWNKMYFRIIDEIGTRYGTRIAGYWQDGPGPDGIAVRKIMLKHTPDAAIWLNSCATRADLPPANLLGGEYIVTPLNTNDPTTRLTTPLQNSITLNGDWTASGNRVKYPVENLYRMTVTMAATEGQVNGGFVMAAGPWSNNDWPPGTVDLMKAMGILMKRNGASIYGTVPSTAFVTTSTDKQPAWGCATQTPDGKTVYAHVLRPPKDGNRVELGIPANDCRFREAKVLGGENNAKLEQTPTGVAVTLPAGVSWDSLDTVIVLTVAR